jgi:hypothetical protein
MLLRPVGAELARAAAGSGTEVWVVAGTGRVLPEAVFERCVAGAPGEVLEVGLAARVGGPAGLLSPTAGLDPGDCPAPASLTAAWGRR